MNTNTQLSGTLVERVPTPMEESIANCQAIVAAFTMLDSLKDSSDAKVRRILLINSAKLAPTIADC
tara:strand:+ start:73 stop:270 length:198 start_codon:yes stop_codon:yes gene_type:complete